MLEHIDAAVTLAVSDMEKAQTFYRDVLGLPEVSRMGRDLISYESGNVTVSIYRSSFAGSNKGTAVAWDVGDKIDAVVADLKSRGVEFEHYDLPGSILQGDVHVNGGMKTAWFKDPDGNLLNLVSR